MNWTDENIFQTAQKQFYFVIAYPTDARTDIDAFINSLRYMTREGMVVKLPNLNK